MKILIRGVYFSRGAYYKDYFKSERFPLIFFLISVGFLWFIKIFIHSSINVGNFVGSHIVILIVCLFVGLDAEKVRKPKNFKKKKK